MDSGVTTTLDNTKKLKRNLMDILAQELLVGITEDSPNDAREDSIETNTMVGYYNEFGELANGTPRRPFLIPGTETAINDNTALLKEAATRALIPRNNATDIIAEAFREMGMLAVADVHELTPVDTGQLKDAITFEVVKND